MILRNQAGHDGGENEGDRDARGFWEEQEKRIACNAIELLRAALLKANKPLEGGTPVFGHTGAGKTTSSVNHLRRSLHKALRDQAKAGMP